MISVLSKKLRDLRKVPDGTVRNEVGIALVATEELLFWGGLGALVFGAGPVAVLGSVAVVVSIVLALTMLVYV